MSFYDWLKAHGDDLFVFVSLIAASLQSDPQISPAVLHWIVDAGVVAAIGHKVFFPSNHQELPK